MPNRRNPTHRMKNNSVKVRKTRELRATIRPFGYQVNHRWRTIERHQHIEYSGEIILLRDTLLGLGLLFAILWAFFRLI